MKVGVNILNFGPGVSPESLLGWARVAELLGYHSVMISDHVAITPSVRSRYPEPFYDTFTTLAWLAGQTERVSLGTTVCVLPYRHPVLTARLVANIDQLSSGRFIFGVGVGNPEDEFAVLGAPHARRGLLANETLGAMQALWNADGEVGFKGRIVQFDGVSGIATWQQPRPPVWVGGMSEAALKRTVRYGDAWHPILRTTLSVKESHLDVMSRFATEAGKPAPAFCPRIRLDLREHAIDGERISGSGSIDQIRDDLHTLEGMGAEHVILDWFTGDIEATRDHEHGFHMLTVLAEGVIDLAHEALR